MGLHASTSEVKLLNVHGIHVEVREVIALHLHGTVGISRGHISCPLDNVCVLASRSETCARGA